MAGEIIAKQNGIAAGLGVAGAVFKYLDPSVRVEPQVPEGAAATNRMPLARIAGPARALLTGERMALNFLGRMSGIATLTHQFVAQVPGTRAVILDTRKTAPGLRTVDKLAVRLGGGQNHRIGLYDMILIKDNHIDFAGSLQAAVTASARSRRRAGNRGRNPHPGRCSRRPGFGRRTDSSGQYVP